MKVVVNYLTSMGRCVIAESLRLGMRSGFGKDFLFDALKRSRAGDWKMLHTHGGNMVRDRYRRPLSTLNVILKDIGLGLKQAKRTGAITPVGNACAPLFKGRRARRPWRVGQFGGLSIVSRSGESIIEYPAPVFAFDEQGARGSPRIKTTALVLAG